MFLVNFCNFLISELNAPSGPSLANGAYTCIMHCYEGVEVRHATRRNKPARFTSLQVVQTANISDWRERHWTPEAWNGTKTRTCYPHPMRREGT